MSRPRALLSVSNKHGLADFAQQLVDAGYELLSTGGTARALREAGLPVTSVSDVTEHPEILDGRVKTLHPRIHGGILFRRDDDSHRHTLAEHNIGPIDIVVVNLYPFEATVARDGVTWADAIENIDIGGPTLVRAAAKSCDAVTVVVDPKDYPTIGAAIADGGTSTEQRRSLALKAFEHTSRYDQAISAWFHQQLTSSEATEEKTPAQIDVTLQCAQTLRYGENPHQQAGLYHPPTEPELGGIYGPMKRLWGKALSYNNVLDLDAAVALVAEFEAPAASVIKHTNPAGCAVVPEADSIASAILAAYLLARSGDPISAFGGIVALNTPVHAALAKALTETFLEVVAAPGFDDDALTILKGKKNLRIIEAPGLALEAPPPAAGLQLRTLGVGTLVQSADASLRVTGFPKLNIATARAPEPHEQRAMDFLWRVCKHIRSNAIVLGGPDTPSDWPADAPQPAPHGLRTYGVGAGQMSRVDAVKIAVDKATHDLHGATLASDAFFPFADGLEIAVKAGITSAIQPGGSRRDAEVIAAADAAQLAMAFTGQRHFRH